jgi:plasmid stabilization system protein ParE
MRLSWTTPATNDLYNIVEHIKQENPNAASKVAETLYDGCSGLENFPNLGRKGRIAGSRELVFSGVLTSLCIALLTKSSKFSASTTELRIGHSPPGAWIAVSTLASFCK